MAGEGESLHTVSYSTLYHTPHCIIHSTLYKLYTLHTVPYTHHTPAYSTHLTHLRLQPGRVGRKLLFSSNLGHGCELAPQLSHDTGEHCTLYTVHCSLYSVHCSLYSVQCGAECGHFHRRFLSTVGIYKQTFSLQLSAM